MVGGGGVPWSWSFGLIGFLVVLHYYVIDVVVVMLQKENKNSHKKIKIKELDQIIHN